MKNQDLRIPSTTNSIALMLDDTGLHCNLSVMNVVSSWKGAFHMLRVFLSSQWHVVKLGRSVHRSLTHRTLLCCLERTYRLLGPVVFNANGRWKASFRHARRRITMVSLYTPPSITNSGRQECRARADTTVPLPSLLWLIYLYHLNGGIAKRLV